MGPRTDRYKWGEITTISRLTLPKVNSKSPWKVTGPQEERRTSSNHHFSGASCYTSGVFTPSYLFFFRPFIGATHVTPFPTIGFCGSQGNDRWNRRVTWNYYLEDDPLTCKWLVTMVNFPSPKNSGCPTFPNGMTPWLINGGDPNHLRDLAWSSKC